MSSQLPRWKVKLREYEFDVIHEPGKINSNADALSRNPVETSRENKNENIDSDASEEDYQGPLEVRMFSRSAIISDEDEVWYHKYPVERLFSTCFEEASLDSTRKESNEALVSDTTIIENDCLGSKNLREFGCLDVSKRKLPLNDMESSLKRVRTNDTDGPPRNLSGTIVESVRSRSGNDEKLEDDTGLLSLFESGIRLREVCVEFTDKSILNTVSTSDKDSLLAGESGTCPGGVVSISRENKACARELVRNVVKEAPDLNVDDEEISEDSRNTMLGELHIHSILDKEVNE